MRVSVCACLPVSVVQKGKQGGEKERETSLEGKGMGYLRRCSGVHVM